MLVWNEKVIRVFALSTCCHKLCTITYPYAFVVFAKQVCSRHLHTSDTILLVQFWWSEGLWTRPWCHAPTPWIPFSLCETSPISSKPSALTFRLTFRPLLLSTSTSISAIRVPECSL